MAGESCEWDASKNRTNAKKHGIAFEDAARMFDGPVLEQTDDRFDYEVGRIIAFGTVNSFGGPRREREDSSTG